MAIDGMLDQIKSDEGVCGARVRKATQRSKDASPLHENVKTPAAAPLSEEEQLELDFFNEGVGA